MLRERRGGVGATPTPCDRAFNHVISMAALVRLHKVKWAYVSKKLGKYWYTTIDHMYSSPALGALMREPRTIDGMEVGKIQEQASGAGGDD